MKNQLLKEMIRREIHLARSKRLHEEFDEKEKLHIDGSIGTSKVEILAAISALDNKIDNVIKSMEEIKAAIPKEPVPGE